MTLNLFHTCHPKESILETGTLEVFLAWKLHADGGGVGVVSERDLELLMDAEGGTAREMGMFPPFSLMHLPERLACGKKWAYVVSS
jgi:CBS domain-containing protein